MLPEEQDNFLEKIKKIPTQTLQLQFAKGVYGDGGSFDSNYKLVKYELDRRTKEESFELARQNVEATKGLVRATRGLVFITGLLVLLTAGNNAAIANPVLRWEIIIPLIVVIISTTIPGL